MGFVKTTIAFFALVSGVILLYLGGSNVSGFVDGIGKPPRPGNAEINVGAAVTTSIFLFTGTIFTLASINHFIKLMRNK